MVRPLLLTLSLIGGATAATAAMLYVPALTYRAEMQAFPISHVEYRFAEKYCRAQFNNPVDRNACMMRAAGTPLEAPVDERDER